MSKGLILVIEDDDDNMELIKFLLNKANYEVLTASNGHTGLEMANSKKPDLVLLDLAIPGIDGWNLAKRIRSTPDIAETPLVAVPAHIRPRDRQEAIDAGCNGFLTKPLDVANFVSNMEAYLKSD